MSGGILGCHSLWGGAGADIQWGEGQGCFPASSNAQDSLHSPHVNSVEAGNLPQRAILGQSLPPWGLHCSGGKQQ